MKLASVLTGFMFVLAVASVCNGDEERWGNEAELSFVDTGGNTDVTRLSGKDVLKYKLTSKLDGAWNIAGLYGESEGERNAESYLTELRLDYHLMERLHSFAMAVVQGLVCRY